MVKLSELNKEFYRSGELGKMIGVSTKTIQNYCNQGKIEFTQINKTNRVIPKSEVIRILKSYALLIDDSNNKKDIIYARVSTNKQKSRGDLDRQISMIEKYVVYQNPSNLEVITDVASGLNDKRKGIVKLINMIQNDEVSRVFITHKDRLTRFGFNFIKQICDFHGVSIIEVSSEVNSKTESEELAEDIIAVIHSFSGKLYGMRKQLKETICKELGDDTNDIGWNTYNQKIK